MNKDESLRIRKLIGRTGLDYLTLSEKIGANVKSVYKWMNGTSSPSAAYLLAIICLIDEDKLVDSIKG